MSARTHSLRAESAGAELSRRAGGSISRDPAGPRITATTIGFTGPATIEDSGSGLLLVPGELIQVRGSLAGVNDRRFRVVTAAAGSITVAPGMITTSAAGPNVTIEKIA